jgi:hypothetical protein
LLQLCVALTTAALDGQAGALSSSSLFNNNQKTKQMNQAEFTLKEMNGVQVLQKDGIPCLCPFRNPFLTPGAIQGHATINNPICSSSCMFFNLAQNGTLSLNNTKHLVLGLNCVKTEFYIKSEI